jgi:hypothetical protein
MTGLVPGLRGPMQRLRRPGARLIRLPIAIVLVLGGFLAVLPFFGLWMIPVGLLLIAADLPALQTPVAGAIIRGRRRIVQLRRRWFG